MGGEIGFGFVLAGKFGANLRRYSFSPVFHTEQCAPYRARMSIPLTKLLKCGRMNPCPVRLSHQRDRYQKRSPASSAQNEDASGTYPSKTLGMRQVSLDNRSASSSGVRSKSTSKSSTVSAMPSAYNWSM